MQLKMDDRWGPNLAWPRETPLAQLFDHRDVVLSPWEWWPRSDSEFWVGGVMQKYNLAVVYQYRPHLGDCPACILKNKSLTGISGW